MTASTVRQQRGKQLADDLRAAAGVLRRDGWTQEQLHSKNSTAHDLQGAIYVATGYHLRDDGGIWRATPVSPPAARRADACVHFMARVLPAQFVGDWNDQRCRSKDEAVDALMRAADEAERSL